MNNKALVLRIFALILFLIGGLSLYENIKASEPLTRILIGTGPLIMGVAMLIIARSQAIQKK